MIERCHLWKKKEVAKEDLRVGETLELLKTFIEESHESRRLLRCRDCGQLYFYEFLEDIDWVNGNDPQYVTLIPVETADEALKLAQLPSTEFMKLTPRIQKDWPADAAEPKVYRVGRDKNIV